jgi:hypothetical protein
MTKIKTDRKRRFGTSHGKTIPRPPGRLEIPDTQKLSELTGKELRALLTHHKVTQQQFARITGQVGSTVRRWCSGKKDGRIPLWVDLIFELFRAKPSVALREIGSRGPRPSDPAEMTIETDEVRSDV